MATVARQPLWATWLLFVLVNGAVAGTSAVLLGITHGVGLKTLLFLGMFAASAGCAISLIPGAAFYGLYEALSQIRQPKWEYDEAGNYILFLGSLGPSIFLVLCMFTIVRFRLNPLQLPAIKRLFGVSTAASFAGLLLAQHLEI